MAVTQVFNRHHQCHHHQHHHLGLVYPTQRYKITTQNIRLEREKYVDDRL